MSETDETAQPSETTSSDAAKSGSTVVRSVVTFGAIAVVVAVLTYLGTLDHPPDLPSNDVHKFRFNTNSQLVGLALEAGEDAPSVEHAAGLAYDKKGVEKRVNGLCINCHGAPVDEATNQVMNLTNHPCQSIGKCVPAKHHPPKNSCIKCHRHGEK